MSELLNYVQLQIAGTCLKCEESLIPKDFSIIFNKTYSKHDIIEIHGGEDVFYLSIVGCDRGIYRYTI